MDVIPYRDTAGDTSITNVKPGIISTLTHFLRTHTLLPVRAYDVRTRAHSCVKGTSNTIL